jgi:PAS domain-containing protein
MCLTIILNTFLPTAAYAKPSTVYVQPAARYGSSLSYRDGSYFMLNNTDAVMPGNDMDASPASHTAIGQNISVGMILKENWLIVVAALTAVFSIIIVLLLQKQRAERMSSEQKQLLEEAERIAELKQTITSLLDNMPGLNFTKDANTGVYLACNKDFAKYAHKESPEAVIGLTAAEIFGQELADRFDEEDRIALSMDMPYIIFEDVLDAKGKEHQLQTTKLKYTDVSGRQCVLGICQDMTEMVRIRRESATSKEAYEKARSTGIIYTHIAQTLARGYTDLYYVNVDTEEYIVSSAVTQYAFMNRNDLRFRITNPEALYAYTENELKILMDELAD